MSGGPDAIAFAPEGGQWAGLRVIVTGGAGFIGSNLVCRLLDRGALVTVIDNYSEGGGANPANLAGIDGGFRQIRMDLRDAGSHRDAFEGCRCVFHLAAMTGHVASMDDPVADLSANALATASLLHVVRSVCPEARLVFTSTRQVYGAPQYLPVDERHATVPPDVNAVSKLCAEQLIALFGRAFGISHVSLRLTNTYGPRMRIRDARQMFLGVWIRSLLEGRAITVFGDGLQRRDFLHVDDAVDALLLAGQGAGDAAIYNLGTSDVWSLAGLAEHLCQLGPKGSRFELVPFPAERKAIDVGDFITDGSAFGNATGWLPTRGMTEGLTATLAYFRKHFALYAG